MSTDTELTLWLEKMTEEMTEEDDDKGEEDETTPPPPPSKKTKKTGASVPLSASLRVRDRK